jgi:hypothetical protein
VKRLRIRSTESYLEEISEKKTKEVKSAKTILGFSVPNPAGRGPQLDNPFADKEAEREEQFKAAAQIVGSKLYAIRPVKDAALLDMSALRNEADARKKAIEDLSKDQNFRAFVLSEIAKKDRDRFEPENMSRNWQNYCKTLDSAKDDYQQQLSAVRNNGPVPANLAFFHPEVIANVLEQDGDNGFEQVEKKETNFGTKDNLKAQAKAMLNSAEHEGKERALEQTDFVKAANLIVADTLLTRTADMTIFDTDAFKNEQGDFSIDKMNKTLVDLRDQVIADPLFQRVLAKRVTESEIVSAYHREVNKEVNKKISKNAKRESDYKKDAQTSAAHQKYAAENTIELTNEEMDFIKKTYDNIKKYNQGKDPSDLMQKLTTALDGVVGEQGNKISIQKMEALNKATLDYYKERQGRIFSPVTKKGKARLGAVERMAFLTDSVMDRAAKQEKKAKKDLPVMK